MRITDFDYITQYDSLPDRKVLLVGMLPEGPVGRAFTMSSPEKVNLYLGENEMTSSYQHLVDSDIPPENILFYRLNGQTSKGILTGMDDAPLIEFQTLSGHEWDNNIRITVSMEGLSVVSNYSEENVNTEKRRNFSRSYLFEEFPTTTDIADAVMNDANLGLTNLIAQPLSYEYCLDVFIPGTFLDLDGGDSQASMVVENSQFDELTQMQYLELFEERTGSEESLSSANLLDYPIEFYYFPDFPVNDSTESKAFIEHAGRLAQVKAEETNLPTISLFRTDLIPGVEEGDFDEEVLYQMSFDKAADNSVLYNTEETTQFVIDLLSMFSEEERASEWMKHVQVVIGESMEGERVTPGSHAYLLKLMSHSIHQPLTNESLVDFGQLRVNLPKESLARLTASGYICIVPSIRKGHTVTKAQSMNIDRGTILSRYYHRRVVGYLSRDISLILERYVGNTKNYFRQSQVLDSISEYLEFYRAQSSIVSFDIEKESMDDFYDTERININLMLYGEIGEISTTIQVSNEGWAFDLWTISN